MANNITIPLSNDAQIRLMSYYSSLANGQSIDKAKFRHRLIKIDKAYQRETNKAKEHLRARQANEAGDNTRYQDIDVPVVMPQIESAVVYQTSVFLTGSPIFGVVAGPKFMDEALQMESILEENAIKGSWTRELILFFRDGFKYNFCAAEVSWKKEVSVAIETNISSSIDQGTPKEVIWAGNTVKRLNPYNVFVDTRVEPSRVHVDGDFAGYTEMMSRIKLKSFIAALPDKITGNIRAAFESASPSNHDTSTYSYYYSPTINDVNNMDNSVNVGTNWMHWANLDSSDKKQIKYKDFYEVSTLYCRILPAEFNIITSKSKTPQIYKLIIVNHKVIIHAELQTNAHNLLPILIGQPLEDGLEYQTKSLAENGMPFQSLASAYLSSIIRSRRRAISDRTLFDPSRITTAAINSDNPSAKIPVRPKSYGDDISKAVWPFPYREDQAGTSMQQISAIVGLANTLVGQNQAQQGQFVKGNKTLQEFDSVMQNANGRDQLASILLEAQVFAPMKKIFKLNTLQFQGGTTIYNRDKDQVVEIDPVKLRKAVMEFKVSDGLTPAAKLLNTEAFTVALQVLGSSPHIASGYNIAPLFSYIMKTQGAKLTEFEKSPEQIAYEQAYASWQQIAMAAIDKDQTPPPAPIPEQFNYNPNNQTPSGETEDTQTPTQQLGA